MRAAIGLLAFGPMHALLFSALLLSAPVPRPRPAPAKAAPIVTTTDALSALAVQAAHAVRSGGLDFVQVNLVSALGRELGLP